MALSMANLIRSAKSGSEWTSYDLDAFHIRIDTVDIQEFFRRPVAGDGSALRIDPIILDHVNAPVGVNLSRDVRLFFRLLRDVVTCDDTVQDSFVDDFTLHLLGPILRVDEPNYVFHQGENFQFIMCGRQVDARPNIVMRDSDNHRVLLIVQNKRPFFQGQVEPQLVASAIAAFHTDNSRCTAVGLQPVQLGRYIGIVMIGVAPRFYEFSITRALVDAVRYGQFPAEKTIVRRLVPPIPTPNVNDYLREGMLPLLNRRACFQCFEAFTNSGGAGGQ